MTTITANVIADSISPQGVRLTTLHLRYPRFIHSEVMTHRVFSRNARSSRAVPIKAMIEEIKTDPVVPLHWGAAQSGMQAYEECYGSVEIEMAYRSDMTGLYSTMDFPFQREKAWLYARDEVVRFAEAFMKAGYAKQLVNRLLEPFMHIDTLVTSTSWDNFFELRDHEAAEPHIRMLAQAMKKELADESRLSYTMCDWSQWHLPYVKNDDHRNLWDTYREGAYDIAKKVSVARCARISYKPFEGLGSIESDVALADRLASSGHWSPFEHIATPDSYVDARAVSPQWRHPELSRNFTGWKQYRALVGG